MSEQATIGKRFDKFSMAFALLLAADDNIRRACDEMMAAGDRNLGFEIQNTRHQIEELRRKVKFAADRAAEALT